MQVSVKIVTEFDFDLPEMPLKFRTTITETYNRDSPRLGNTITTLINGNNFFLQIGPGLPIVKVWRVEIEPLTFAFQCVVCIPEKYGKKGVSKARTWKIR